MSYEKSASVYDAIYQARKNYQIEAERVHQLIQQVNPGARTLLDVACGTGLHDQYLAEWYELEGLDLSEAQLAVARRRLPEVTFHHGDMTNFDLGKSFDAVICMFSAIGHLTTRELLQSAIACMVRHLSPRGVLIVEPWLHPEVFRPGTVRADFVDQPELKVSRITLTKVVGRVSELEMHHTVGRPDGVEYFIENHRLALYSIEEYLAALGQPNLVEVRHDPEGLMGRGLFIARRVGPGSDLPIDSPLLTGALNLYDPLPGYSDENNPDPYDLEEL